VIGRIQRRGDFARLRRSGLTARAGALRVSFLHAEPGAHAQPVASVGFAVPRQYGPAVRRNRARRRLREVFRALDASGGLRPGSYVVSLRPCASEPGYGDLRVWVETAVGRLGRG
jgi:ribonuclease P protein component